jgi:ubiquinone/menaquinone biosynthesis C-methylase UbiE
MGFKTTEKHKAYWSQRKIDWKEAYASTWNHPHRQMIVDALRGMKFTQLLELGCASGPNLIRITKEFPGVQVGGIDISADAIETARGILPPNAVLDVGSADNCFFADKCTDVVLADACLIYLGPEKIDQVMKEMRRVARKHVVLVEFHEPSWWRRLAVWWKSGYFAYDYEKLLKKHGFWDIEIKRIPEEVWGYPWSTFGAVITAKI